jgi:anthranilate phosphoribosyltransferase
MKILLAQLVAGKPLTEDQATEAFELIMAAEATAAQMGALLAMIQNRGPTVDEITGAARVMRGKVAAVAAPEGLTLLDTCGTGGDHARTFNISTAAAIVSAGAGRPRQVAVAKHGNRSVSSSCGSSQVLETLGVNLQVSAQTLTRCLDEAGICFCFAPRHHPAMKHAMPVRGELGFRTIFNILGPLTNPAGARHQLIGVFSPALTDQLAQVLERLGARRAMIVCGQFGDGVIDELTTTGPTTIAELSDGKVVRSQFDATTLGLDAAKPDQLRAESPEASAEIIREVLDGRRGPARDIVALNAAAALTVAGAARDLSQGLEHATAAIDDGAAARALQKLVELTRQES